MRYAVESFMPKLANHIVQLYEDNQAVVAILMSGTSRSPELMRELRKLFDIILRLEEHHPASAVHPVSPECARQQVEQAERPRRLEAESEDVSGGSYQVGDPGGVDRIATANNAQCRRFNSRWGNP